MKYANKDVAIHYFTNPAMENEPLGKIVDGVMHQVARVVPTRKVNTEYEADYTHKMGAKEVPSIIFTDTSGTKTHLYVGGNQMSTISLEGVTKILDDIINFNTNNYNG
jgi:hypothetical protein|tara:strand:- start:547 stop:870 length:324 start_codon:yes stop_codon:yes gene_type:complete